MVVSHCSQMRIISAPHTRPTFPRIGTSSADGTDREREAPFVVPFGTRQATPFRDGTFSGSCLLYIYADITSVFHSKLNLNHCSCRPSIRSISTCTVHTVRALDTCARLAGESTKLLVGDSIGAAVDKQRELETEYDRLLREREDLLKRGGTPPPGPRAGKSNATTPPASAVSSAARVGSTTAFTNILFIFY